MGLGKSWDLRLDGTCTLVHTAVSERGEGRSDAESQPCRTRNVAGEPVVEEEVDPLGREGSGARGRMDGSVAAERAE